MPTGSWPPRCRRRGLPGPLRSQRRSRAQRLGSRGGSGDGSGGPALPGSRSRNPAPYGTAGRRVADTSRSAAVAGGPEANVRRAPLRSRAAGARPGRPGEYAAGGARARPRGCRSRAPDRTRVTGRGSGRKRKADALLLITARSTRGEATGKLFEYLGAGRPILALAQRQRGHADRARDGHGCDRAAGRPGPDPRRAPAAGASRARPRRAVSRAGALRLSSPRPAGGAGGGACDCSAPSGARTA